MKGEEYFNRLTQSAQEAAMRLQVRSALNPCLWLCGIISFPSFIAAVFTIGGVQVLFAVVGCIPVAIFGIGYTYFMLMDPDKLQSEDYQIQKKALELIEEKGGRIPLSPASIEAITNPRLKRIGPGDDEEVR